MIILVTLMVAASRVLSIPIDEITPDSSYVAVDSSVPVRIDPATITRLFRDQSAYPVSSPPFNKGFHYTVPARLVLYQPPPGHSYPAGRANVKEHGNCDNQHSPIAVGEYDKSSQHLFKRSNDQAGIPADVLPRSNVPRGSARYASYYGPQSIQSTDNQDLIPSASEFSGNRGHLDVRLYNSLPPDEVQVQTPGNLPDSIYGANEVPKENFPNYQQQYSQKMPVSYGESKQGLPITSQFQDQQDVLATKSVANANNRLQDSWSQSSGPTDTPRGKYVIGSALNIHENYRSAPDHPPNSGPQFLSFEDLNIQRHGGSSYLDGSSESFSRQDVVVGSGPESRNSRIPISTSQVTSQPIINHHGDNIIMDSYDRQSSSDVILPQSSEIPPSYLVGFKILTPLTSTPLWDLPNFPKRMVEPWASKIYEDSEYSPGRYKMHSRLLDSSRAAVRDRGTPPFRFRPPPYDNLSNIRTKTPWVVLMVPQDSLFKKDYNIGMKTPWLSLSPRTYGTNVKDQTFTSDQAGIILPRKENLNVAESELSQSSSPTEIKKVLTTDYRYPVSDYSLKAPSVLKQGNGLEQLREVGGARSIVDESTTKPIFQNQQALSQDSHQDLTIITGGNIVPSTATKYTTTGDAQRLIDHTAEDQVISNTSENEAASDREAHPRGTVQTFINEVIVNGSSLHSTSGLQPLAVQPTGMTYTDVDQTEIERERLQSESMILEDDTTPEIIHYANSGNVGSRLLIEESGATSPGTTVAKEAHAESELVKSVTRSEISSASNLAHTIGDEKNLKKVGEQVDFPQTLEASSGSNIVNNSDTGINEQERISKANMVIDGEDSSTVISYAPSGGLDVQQMIQHRNGPESATAILGEAPSNIGDYLTSGMQQVEEGNTPQNKTAIIEGANSPSQVVRYVTESSPGTYSQLGAMGSGMAVTGSADSTGSQQIVEQSNGFGSATTLSDGAPSSSKIVRYVMSRGGAIQEDPGEASLTFKTGGSATVTNSGSTGAQHIIEEGPEIKRTQVQGGSSMAQVIHYVTEGSGTTSHLGGMAGGSEAHTVIEQYSHTNDTEPQQVIQQADGLESTTTTILGGDPSSSKIIRYVTTGGNQGENLREGEIALGNGGSSTVTRYVTPGSLGTQQIIEEGIAPPTVSTLINGDNSGSQVIRYVIEGNKDTPVKGMTQYNYTDVTGSQQVNDLGSATNTVGGVPSTSKTIRYATSGGILWENVGESEIELGNKDSSTVMRYVTTGTTGTQHILEEGKAPQTMLTLIDGGDSTSQVVRYVTEGSTGGIASGNEGHTLIEQYNITSGTGPQEVVEQASGLESTTTILKAAPSTSKIIRYDTSGGTEEERLTDGGGSTSQVVHYLTEDGTGGAASGSEGHTVIEQHNITSGTGPQEVVEQASGLESTTILRPAPSTSKIIRYVTSGGTEGEAVVRGSGSTSQVVRYVTEGGTGGMAGGSDGHTVIEQYNDTSGTGPQQIVQQASGLESTTILSGAPSTSKIIHYVTSGGFEGENLDGEKIEVGSGGSSTVTGFITPVSKGIPQIVEESIAPQAISTVVDGGNSGSQVIHYVTESSTGMTSRTEDMAGEMEDHLTGPQKDLEQANSLGSITTQMEGALSTPKIIRYVSSGGGLGLNLGGSKIKLGNEGSSTSKVYVTGGTGAHQIIEEEVEVPETMPALVGGGESASQMVRYITESSSVPSPRVKDMILGQNENLIDSQNNYTGGNGSQQVVEQDNGLGSSATIMGEAPSSSKIIRYVTTGATVKDLGETRMSVENEGPSTTSYVTSGSTVPEQIMEQPNSLQSAITIIDKAPLATTISYVTAGGEVQESIGESGNVGTSPVTQRINTGSNHQVIEGRSSSQTEITQVGVAPSSSKVIRYVIKGGAGLQSQDYTTLGKGGSSVITHYNNPDSTVMKQIVAQDNSVGSTSTLVDGGTPTSKIIRYVKTLGMGGEEQGSEVELGPTTLTQFKIPGGTGPKSTATFVSGIPTTSKIIRYIKTADGEERQEIIGDSNLAIENEGVASVTGHGNNGTVRQIMEAGNTQHIETNPAEAVSTTKIIRYVTTASGSGEEGHGSSSVVIGDGVPLAAQTGQVVEDELQSTTTLEKIPSGSQTIRYVIAGGMGTEQQLGQPMALGTGGLSSIKHFVKTGGPGAQQVIQQDTIPESITTVVDGAPSTYKTIRYVSNDGAETQQMVGTSNTNLPSQTITRYITMPSTDSASSGANNLQKGGSTVTRYITKTGSGGASSQLLSGQGNLQSSKTIVSGAPSTVTRYLKYPQQSGLGGTRYIPNFQPLRTSTIVKPASFLSGALPGSAQQSSRSYVMSPP